MQGMGNPVTDPLSLDCLKDDLDILGVVPPKPVENRLSTTENSGESSVQGPKLPSLTVYIKRKQKKRITVDRQFFTISAAILRAHYVDDDLSPVPKKKVCTDAVIPRIHWHDIKWDLLILLTDEYDRDPQDYTTSYMRGRVRGYIRCESVGSLDRQLRLFLCEYIPYIFPRFEKPKSYEISAARDTWVNFNNKLTIIYKSFRDLDKQTGSMVRYVWSLAYEFARTLSKTTHQGFVAVADSVIEAINNERNGIAIDTECVHEVIQIFVTLHNYEDAFESPYFCATQRFYEEESQELVAEYDVPQYLRHVEKRISQETSYFCGYLDLKSKGPTMRIVHKCLVTNHTAHIVNKGCKILFNNFQGFNNDLSLMYRLFKNSEGGFEHLKDAFVAHIKEVGEARMNAIGLEKKLVVDLFELKWKLDQLVAVCFEKNPMFLEALNDAFAHVVNSKKSKFSELITKFLDKKLRKGKTSSDNDFNNLMDQVIMLFRFIYGKDVFEAFYKRDLSKRLLFGLSASMDAERSMVNKLRQECGPRFTSKIECMFQDMDLSRDVCALFKTMHNDNLPSEQQVAADFSVFVLTAKSWPVTANFSKVTIPKQLCNLQIRYEKFYAVMNKRRRLTWHHNLSSATLVGKFGKNKYELDVSMYQALVLLMYNDKKEFTVEAIQAATKIERSEFVRTLSSLLTAKNPILIREKFENVYFSDTEIIRFNDSYYSKGYKVKLAQLHLKETKKDQHQLQAEIVSNRQLGVDAAIVRLIKEHHRLTLRDLFNDLVKSLRFNITICYINQRVETLIEREYLKRCEDDVLSFYYVV